MKYLVYSVLALVAVLVGAAFPALAQVSEVPGPFDGWVGGLWSILEPLVMVFVSIVGPALVTWIAYHVVTFLNIKDENERKVIEERMRKALHEAAANAIKFALTKAGINPLATSVLEISKNSTVITDAVKYLQSKNPGTIEAFKLSPKGVEDIVMANVPEVVTKLSPAPQAVVNVDVPKPAAKKAPVPSRK